FLVTNVISGDFGPVTLSVSQSALGPIVSSISPVSGSTAGGAPLVITGSGFSSGMTVQIGGAAATNVNVLTPNVATAVTPSGAAGIVNVTATFPNAPSSLLANAFVYEPAAQGRHHTVRH